MPNPTILSLAILKVNWDEESKDYLESFVPFLGECIRLSSDDVVTLPVLQLDIKNRFGLLIPQNALKSVLKRLKRHGYVRQENKVLYPIRDKLELLNFAKVQRIVLGMEEALVKTSFHLFHSAFIYLGSKMRPNQVSSDIWRKTNWWFSTR